MPVSRPVLIALLAAVLACAAFYATRLGGSSGESASSAAPVSKPAPVHPAKPAPVHAAKPAPVHPARPARPAPAAPQRPALPPRVASAYVSGRTLVVFFYGRGADDSATAASVGALRHRGRAAVFSAPIARLSDYGLIARAVGVARAPSVVVARRGRATRLLEGYVDPETLAQEVADLR